MAGVKTRMGLQSCFMNPTNIVGYPDERHPMDYLAAQLTDRTQNFGGPPPDDGQLVDLLPGIAPDAGSLFSGPVRISA